MTNKQKHGNTGRTIKVVFSLFSILFSLAIITGCGNLFDQQNAPSGYGKARVVFAGAQGRTVFPDKNFTDYVYTFTKNGETTGIEVAPDSGSTDTFTLETGGWTVDVEAYVGGIGPAFLAATGTEDFTVTSGTVTVTVVLEEEDTGNGTFTYAITYPTYFEELSLQRLPSLTVVTLNPTITTGIDCTANETVYGVPAGFYLLTVKVRDGFNGGWHNGISEVVHIYPLLETEYTKTFLQADMLPTVVSITEITGITPIIGENPVSTITVMNGTYTEYTGAVTWSSTSDATFDGSSAFTSTDDYTAEIVLTAGTGYTLESITAADFFTVALASSVSYAAGTSTVTANFTSAVSGYFLITDGTDWTNALTDIGSGSSGDEFFIEISGDVNVSGTSTASFGSATGITVTLYGNGILGLSGGINDLIKVAKEQELIIDSPDLTLRGTIDVTGDSGDTATLKLENGAITGGGVSVGTDGEFIMNGGGEIIGNGSMNNGGVFVDGTFIMTGGTISYNNAPYNGGGVNVNDGTFIMTGGTISGNNATNGNGGGVNVGASGTFYIVSGVINGSSESVGANNAASGAALYVVTGGTAEYGNFSTPGDFTSAWSKTGGDDILDGEFGNVIDYTIDVEDGDLKIRTAVWALPDGITLAGFSGSTGYTWDSTNKVMTIDVSAASDTTYVGFSILYSDAGYTFDGTDTIIVTYACYVETPEAQAIAKQYDSGVGLGDGHDLVSANDMYIQFQDGTDKTLTFDLSTVTQEYEDGIAFQHNAWNSNADNAKYHIKILSVEVEP